MILAAELGGAFVAGGATSLVLLTWIAKRKLRQMLRPKVSRAAI